MLEKPWEKEMTCTVELVATLENGETHAVDEFNVRFINPFSMDTPTLEITANGSEKVGETGNVLSMLLIRSSSNNDAIYNGAHADGTIIFDPKGSPVVKDWNATVDVEVRISNLVIMTGTVNVVVKPAQ